MMETAEFLTPSDQKKDESRRLPCPSDWDFDLIETYFQAIRRTYDIDPDFVHRPRFGTNQYSQAFVDWLVERLAGDPEFVARARARYHELRVNASRSRG